MNGSRFKDLPVRIGSAIILLLIIIGALDVGKPCVYLLIALACIMMALEWTQITFSGEHKQFFLHAAAGITPIFLMLRVSDHERFVVCLSLIAMLWVLSMLLVYFGRARNEIWAYIGVPYIGLSSLSFGALYDWGKIGPIIMVILLFAVVLADSCAYFSGRILGGPKLAPSLSPNKTWAGLAGAVVGASVGGVVASMMFRNEAVLMNIAFYGILGAISQGGDLFKSSWKRHFSVKDSGTLIPGHGGVIDRIDGFVAMAIFMFFGLWSGLFNPIFDSH